MIICIRTCRRRVGRKVLNGMFCVLYVLLHHRYLRSKPLLRKRSRKGAVSNKAGMGRMFSSTLFALCAVASAGRRLQL